MVLIIEQEKIEVEAFIPKGKRKCSGCGEIIDDKNVFCPKCGAKKEVVEEAKENATVTDNKVEEVKAEKNVCPNCGTELAEGDVFCANCGYKMDGQTKEVEVDAHAESKVEE